MNRRSILSTLCTSTLAMSLVAGCRDYDSTRRITVREKYRTGDLLGDDSYIVSTDGRLFVARYESEWAAAQIGTTYTATTQPALNRNVRIIDHLEPVRK